MTGRQNCEAAEALGIHAIRYQDEAQCVQALERLGPSQPA